MIGLDSVAAVAAFQKNPKPEVAAHRDRVRAFLRAHDPMRVMFPAVALSEYLWRIERVELDEGVRRVAADRLFTPAFDEVTAEVAANIGKKFVAERGLGPVAREVGSDRVALKSDLMIVASAVQHRAQHFLTADAGCCEIARFAGLNAVLVSQLPDPPAAPPMPPPSPAQGGKQKSLLDDLPLDAE